MSEVICLMLAAGRGNRMSTQICKQYLELMGKPVLYYSLKAFEPYVDSIIVVTALGEEEYCRKEVIEKYGISKVKAIVAGGRERYLSVYEGLKAIPGISCNNLRGGESVHCTEDFFRNENVWCSESVLRDEKYVLIHDGARPFVDGQVIERVTECVKKDGACIAAVPSKDTVKIVTDGVVEATPRRDSLWLVQTPQAFVYDEIFKAYEKAIASGREDITDDSMVMESFGERKVKVVMGNYDNIKLTTPDDMVTGMAILREKTAF